jgi:ankyrin repeat protein
MQDHDSSLSRDLAFDPEFSWLLFKLPLRIVLYNYLFYPAGYISMFSNSNDLTKRRDANSSSVLELISRGFHYIMNSISMVKGILLQQLFSTEPNPGLLSVNNSNTSMNNNPSLTEEKSAPSISPNDLLVKYVSKADYKGDEHYHIISDGNGGTISYRYVVTYSDDNIPQVTRLLEQGADPNSIDKNHWTCQMTGFLNGVVPVLFLAFKRKNPAMMALLTSFGADPNIYYKDGPVICDRYSVVPKTEFLLIHIANMKEGKFAPYIGWEMSTKMLKALLNGPVPVRVNEQDSETGNTALHCSAANKHTENVKLLLNKNASAFIKNNAGRTALEEAIYCGANPSEHPELISTLKKHMLTVSKVSFMMGAKEKIAPIHRLFTHTPNNTLPESKFCKEIFEFAGLADNSEHLAAANPIRKAFMLSKHSFFTTLNNSKDINDDKIYDGKKIVKNIFQFADIDSKPMPAIKNR